MTLSYQTATPAVNPLPSRVLSFYRWLHRWHEETGDVHPSTGYLARKQKVTERTIYRWLKQLEDAGYLLRGVIVGVERQILPLLTPPEKKRVRGPSGYSCQGANTRADAYRTAQHTPTTAPSPTPPPQDAAAAACPVVVSLEKEASLPPAAAAAIVSEYGPGRVERVLTAYRQQRAKVRDSLRWIRAGCRDDYQPGKRTGGTSDGQRMAKNGTVDVSRSAFVPRHEPEGIAITCGPALKALAYRGGA